MFVYETCDSQQQLNQEYGVTVVSHLCGLHLEGGLIQRQLKCYIMLAGVFFSLNKLRVHPSYCEEERASSTTPLPQREKTICKISPSAARHGALMLSFR